VWPTIAQVLAGGPAPNEITGKAATMVSEWVKKGASRLGTEHPTAQAAAVMDAVWLPIGEAILGPTLGSSLGEFEAIAPPDNPPSSSGSSYGTGWEGYIYKDLRTILGQSVAQPYSRVYCGGGSLEACRTALWKAVQTGVEHLVAEQGSNPLHWHAANVRITFPPDPAMKTTMRWTNRSTFQQVIEFLGHAE